MKHTLRIATLAAAATVAVVGCATDDPHRSAKTGVAVGAIVGYVLGDQVGGSRSRVVGTAAGALAGGVVGNYMDRQRRELERQLADEERREQLRITEMPGDALRLGIASDATFAFDSDELQAQFRPTYDKIAAVMVDYDQTVIHVVGHTDSIGAAGYNQNLSVRRADAVARYLRSRGVEGDRLVVEGRGESEPLASNNTADGRTRNRRVDIVIKPVIEGRERDAYAAPPYLGA